MPKQYSRKESDFQNNFNEWVEHNWDKPAAFELKVSRTASIPFSAVKEHQLLALLLVKDGKFVYKIPDLGALNPFDSMCLIGLSAYVVVQFWRPRQKEFFMIDAHVWKKEMEISDRKSLTEERAKVIGFSYMLGEVIPRSALPKRLQVIK